MSEHCGVKVITKPTEEMVRERGLQPGGKVQLFIDNEAGKYLQQYSPFLSGMMADSIPLSSEYGSGEIRVNVPYAHRRSLSARHVGLRGPHFFERMKADRLEIILSGAAKVAGAKPKR